jgi:ubiquinone/menaquinone biosynthesis C-methylase UbiE
VSASFDERAAGWDDDPKKVERARIAAAALRGAVELTPRTRVLEYGAGTGLLSQELAPDVGPIVLADPSEGMRSVMAGKLDAGLFGEATVTDLDLSRRPLPDDRFDLIVTLMALHHVPDLPPVLEGFAHVLAPGGSLCILDLEAEDGSFHDPDFEGHEGFDRQELAGWLADAGFAPTRFQSCCDVVRNDRTYEVFLAVSHRRR